MHGVWSHRARASLLVIGILACAQILASAAGPMMTVHFINVGQALSALVEFPCGAMLVDAGSQTNDPDQHLIDYLESFFAKHPALNRTLGLVLITHNHPDHTNSLRRVVETFTVKRYVDNGWTTGKGARDPNWLRQEVTAHHQSITVRGIVETQIESLPRKTGLAGTIIDPFNCGSVNPQIHVLSATRSTNPGWPVKEFNNPNNHSLVTRIDFGSSSILFTGDLEENGIESLLNYYDGPAAGLLNADVWQVGHHGSHNATTAGLLAAISPEVAVIPVGVWTFGRGDLHNVFTTNAYGHPRQLTLDLLTDAISRARTPQKSVMAASGVRSFHQTTITKAIYATGWDGDVRVVADTDGGLTVYRER